MKDQELWRRIAAFDLDAQAVSAPFSVKLAKSEKWSDIYTKRAIEEYRRFVYLSQISEDPVTPSEVVDRVWHMHLTFTRSYWDGLCAEVLGKSLHHDPCEGVEDMPRYHVQFGHTMALYRREFGARAPADIWGDRHAKRKLNIGTMGAVIGGLALVTSALYPDISGQKLMGLGGLIVLIAGGTYAVWNLPPDNKRSKTGHHSGSTVGGCGSGSGCGGGCGGGS